MAPSAPPPVPCPAADIFAYLADFATVARPGIRASESAPSSRRRTGPHRRATWSGRFPGTHLPLEYVILESSDPPRSSRAAWCSGDLLGLPFYDIITVAPRPKGSTVTYDTDLALRGFRRPSTVPAPRVPRSSGTGQAPGCRSAVQLRRVT